jgi:hypothetical protein
MSRVRPFVAVALVYFLSAGFVHDFQALACHAWDSPVDATHVNSRSGCGDTEWELQVNYGFVWDEGAWSATGACTGGYVTCDCRNVPPGTKDPYYTFAWHYDDAYDATWYWRITGYQQPQLTSCSTGNCQSNGYAKETDPTYVESNVGYDQESCLL